ncbi:AI-2E family transporter [Kordiimonas marina]|uniref:AI-2E family transporter n=1 Tax=Kordiimonas marina TaxID=2872312 RepID=UPI001FF29DA6|nr:AI-2E family transporter [Kordiimonas marina]MCJ9428212.1 AI-2E family transporter [Kordiimonas marina]
MNMISNWFRRTLSDPQVVLLLVVLLFAVLAFSFFGHMLAPAIAAIVLAFLLDGPIGWLERRGARPMIALLFVFISFLLLSVITLLAVMPPLVQQIGQFVNDSPKMIARLQAGFLGLHARFPDIISEVQAQGWLERMGNEVANLGPRLVQYSLTSLTSAVSLIVYTVLVPVMVFFFLKDKEQILGWVTGFLPHDKPVLEQVWHESLERAGDYARGKVYEILICGIAAFILYQVLGLRYATLLAVATGLSVIIPYFGAAAVTVPVLLVAYVQWGMSPDFVIAATAYFVLQALDGNLLVPLLFSEAVKLHPNAIIISILLFGGLWGFWGVFFAIPLATLANAVIRAWRARAHDEAQAS